MLIIIIIESNKFFRKNSFTFTALILRVSVPISIADSVPSIPSKNNFVFVNVTPFLSFFFFVNKLNDEKQGA